MQTQFVLLAGVLLASCVGTTLETPSDHPANPSARSVPPEPAATALKSGFDPFESYSGEAANPPPADDHDHAGHADQPAPPESASQPPNAPDHTAHSPPANRATDQTPAATPQTFTCPMHPQIVRDQPGKCPICGMKLVPKKPKTGHPAH